MLAKVSRLAIDGGNPAIPESLPRFNTIGKEEAQAAYDATLKGPLSGYLGGERRGGYHVERLERAWEEMFEVRHAVACNSATSGLLMACMASGGADWSGTEITTTPYTMSGTIAPATLLGADVFFGDIDEHMFYLKPYYFKDRFIISVNLFGHPSPNYPGYFVIEDATQSIMATRNGKLISNASITVFSGNIHKAVQCGEGGMCCTHSHALADWMRLARNHGELDGWQPGLNLRLTEVQAAIWYVQLQKAKNIIARRREIAETLSKATLDSGLGTPPYVEEECEHSYYIWALKCNNRDWVAKALNAEGFPVRAGYVKPLYRLPAFQQDIFMPCVERVEASLITYENCSFDPTDEQIKQMQEAIYKVAENNRRTEI